ncbi:hypothetical protein PC9H_007120 [Pleurotus ostreatus]|uniref:Uncharacterized protein n=2 Tax=Pleurotus ostreatus TaxID=5322 RepID=A0A8H6ZUT5_PLEOS|nr:uncharacterized protein PC9H_007120 [Pleurotus ostreatus]KAF7427903.1 hypothetical protein PC9H_007120 [Pleurotus ostreatus]
MDGEINCKVIHDSLTTPIMTSDPSQMARDPSTKEISKQNTFISPAQAIADAWNKESLENQERWRKADILLRKQFSLPHKRARDTKM